MRRWHLLFSIVLLLIVASGLLLIMPVPQAFAHATHDATRFAPPTPTPDANQVLDEAKQEETNIQTFLLIITIMLVLFSLLITIASVVLGVIGFRGFQNFEQKWDSRLGTVENEWRDHLHQIHQLNRKQKTSKLL